MKNHKILVLNKFYFPIGVEGIEKTFGLGARLIEIQIMKRLYERIGHALEYSPKQEGLVFTEYLTAVKLSHYSPRSLETQ